MRYRSDSSKDQIVAALRKVGAYVQIIERPVDLLVYYRGWSLLECKPITWRKPRKDQSEQAQFIEQFHIPIVRTPDEALLAIGAIS